MVLHPKRELSSPFVYKWSIPTLIDFKPENILFLELSSNKGDNKLLPVYTKYFLFSLLAKLCPKMY